MQEAEKTLIGIIIIVVLSFTGGWLARQAKYEDDNFVKIPKEQWEAIERRSVIYIDTCYSITLPDSATALYPTLEQVTTSGTTTTNYNGN